MVSHRCIPKSQYAYIQSSTIPKYLFFFFFVFVVFFFFFFFFLFFFLWLYNSLCRVLAFSTNSFHLPLSWTRVFQFGTFDFSISFLTSSSQCNFGLPVGLLEMGFQQYIALTILIPCILSMWPSHPSLCALMKFIMFLCFIILSSSWLVFIRQIPFSLVGPNIFDSKILRAKKNLHTYGPQNIMLHYTKSSRPFELASGVCAPLHVMLFQKHWQSVRWSSYVHMYVPTLNVIELYK